MKRISRVVNVLICFCCIIGCGIRIYFVNTNAQQPNFQKHKTGEYVDIGKNYFYYENESPIGYKVKVNKATIISYTDYIKKYNGSVNLIKKSERPDYIYDLEITVKNENTKDSNAMGLNLVNVMLCSDNEMMQVNFDLFGLAYPKLKNEVSFALRANTKMTMHLPYVTNIADKKYINNEKKKLENTKYSLLLSMYPIKKTIIVE